MDAVVKKTRITRVGGGEADLNSNAKRRQGG